MANRKPQSSEGEVFDVDVDIAKLSLTIKTMLEIKGMDEDDEEVVPLPNVNSTILKKVIQWSLIIRTIRTHLKTTKIKRNERMTPVNGMRTS
jgi:hypothetical protein